MGTSYIPESLNDLLPIYYKRLFPYEPYCKWLGAGNIDKNFLARREFSFTLQDDIYLRYLSFNNYEELQKEMIKRLPHKIDIGAVYNARPTDHKKVSLLLNPIRTGPSTSKIKFSIFLKFFE